LQLFITETQVSFLTDIVNTKGFLSAARIGGAFQMLQSTDLVWTHAIRTCFVEEQNAPNDLMPIFVVAAPRDHVAHWHSVYIRDAPSLCDAPGSHVLEA